MKVLKQLRINKGVTQKDLADFLGITRAAYTNIENGKRETDFSSLMKLANYFDVSTDYLLGKTDDPTPPGAKKEAPTELTPMEAAVAYFRSKKGRDPTAEELNMFIAFTKPVLDSLPDKDD